MICVFCKMIESFSTVFFTSSWALTGRVFNIHISINNLFRQGGDWAWLREDSLKGASAPQLARRESRKKSGPAREARNHCFGVRKERGFLLRVPTERRAPPKWASETGVSHGYQLRPQGWAWTANAATAATKNPVCKRRSLPTPWQDATARVLWPRENFPGRTQGALQAIAVSCWPLQSWERKTELEESGSLTSDYITKLQ